MNLILSKLLFKEVISIHNTELYFFWEISLNLTRLKVESPGCRVQSTGLREGTLLFPRASTPHSRCRAQSCRLRSAPSQTSPSSSQNQQSWFDSGNSTLRLNPRAQSCPYIRMDHCFCSSSKQGLLPYTA